MKAKAEVATAQISNDLHEQLLTKDTVSFWKTWKNKINKRRTVVSSVDGCFNVGFPLNLWIIAYVQCS